MAVQAALGSDIALVFDECTPFHVDRDYTAALDRAHPSLAGALSGLARRERPARPARVRDRAGGRVRGHAPGLRAAVATSGCDGIAIGGSLGAEKAQMYEVVGCGGAELGGENERDRDICWGSARWMT